MYTLNYNKIIINLLSYIVISNFYKFILIIVYSIGIQVLVAHPLGN